MTDNISTSERVKQQRESHRVQASPRHQRKAIEESKSPQSAIKSGSNETNTADQSSDLVENRIQATTLSSEAQETMLDMKVVDSRTSTLTLSQISLKQKESPRVTKHKQNSHDIDAVSYLQIEGQGVKLPPETSKQSPRLTTSAAAHREQRINSPRSSSRIAHEAKSPGSLTSLLIRPVSLQHHSGRAAATSQAVNQEQERDDRNSDEIIGGDAEDTGESIDTTAPGDSGGNANHVTTADSEATASSAPEDSSAIQGEKEDLPSKYQDESQDKNNTLTESESQNNTVEKNPTSADCINEGNENRVVSPQMTDPQAVDGTSALITETSLSNVSQDQAESHEDGDIPKSPVVMVKALPTPVRPHSNRPTSSSRKSRCAPV